MKTYDAGNGRNVTIPENADFQNAELIEILRDQLPPDVLVAIAAYLAPAREPRTPKTHNDHVFAGLHDFRRAAIEAAGGYDVYNKTLDQIGL